MFSAQNFDVTDFEAPLIKPLEAIHATQHGRFATTGRPQDSRQLRILDLESSLIEDSILAVSFDDISDFDHAGFEILLLRLSSPPARTVYFACAEFGTEPAER